MQRKLFSLASFVSEHWCAFDGYGTHLSHSLWTSHGPTHIASRHCERWLMAVPSEFTATGSRKEKCRTVPPCLRIIPRLSCDRCMKRHKWLPEQEQDPICWNRPLSKHPGATSTSPWSAVVQQPLCGSVCQLCPLHSVHASGKEIWHCPASIATAVAPYSSTFQGCF